MYEGYTKAMHVFSKILIHNYHTINWHDKEEVGQLGCVDSDSNLKN